MNFFPRISTVDVGLYFLSFNQITVNIKICWGIQKKGINWVLKGFFSCFILLFLTIFLRILCSYGFWFLRYMSLIDAPPRVKWKKITNQNMSIYQIPNLWNFGGDTVFQTWIVVNNVSKYTKNAIKWTGVS